MIHVPCERRQGINTRVTSLDYLLSPPEACEHKAEQLVSIHWNGAEKEFVFLVLSEEGRLDCETLRQQRYRLLETFCSRFFRGFDNVSAQDCAALHLEGPGKATRPSEFWAWDANVGAVWDHSLDLINGQLVGPTSGLASQWLEYSRPCWQLCPQSDGQGCAEEFCRRTAFIFPANMALT
mmetsp:Transcript_98880/g.229116  ORF Transcript_98880/g.229116 Transcript_98880/m.229116 type:complete len:180 (+) Transcript_98880:81-620(+)|eukprot:CAMPEP_0171142318 /NCGR_PEP_ID=MMETSP0766_2-20121228/142211_1 /TAXON_ID=439317 /ORGANISM="Gambierdiscus australes, Strain CAWD 149" /LENGTH=179 /DNA_ID=CAMNT_0011606093 /DNA_START=67 /DNA_END=606 /DNA_ORIENTATION=+